MDKAALLLEVQKIFRSVFNDDQLVLRPDTTQADIEQWDSLNHAVLIDTIEQAFAIKFDLMDMLDIQSAGDICDKIIARKEAA